MGGYFWYGYNQHNLTKFCSADDSFFATLTLTREDCLSAKNLHLRYISSLGLGGRRPSAVQTQQRSLQTGIGQPQGPGGAVITAAMFGHGGAACAVELVVDLASSVVVIPNDG